MSPQDAQTADAVTRNRPHFTRFLTATLCYITFNALFPHAPFSTAFTPFSHSPSPDVAAREFDQPSPTRPDMAFHYMINYDITAFILHDARLVIDDKEVISILIEFANRNSK